VAKSKLFFITPALSGGGIEQSIPILIEQLSQLTSCNIAWVGVNRSEFHREIDGVSIVSMDRESGNGILATTCAIRDSRSLIVSEEKPIVVANGEVAELLALSLPRRIPVICVEHASHPWLMSRKLGYLVRKLISFKDVFWVTVNARQESIWPNIKKFETIYNPIHPTPFSGRDLGVGLIHIGRVTADKGIEMVCLVAQNVGMKLDVYGDGDLLSPLRLKYSQNSDVIFHGFTHDVWEVIGRKRLLISASLHEGDGRNVAEAIMRRQPVLLLDTIDHRRFGLPDIHYFRDLDALIAKIQEHRPDDFDRLRPSEAFAEREVLKRSPTDIAKIWDSFINRIARRRYGQNI
jgi:hypothetical protein